MNLNISENTNEDNMEVDQELGSQSNFNLDDNEDFGVDIRTPRLEIAEEIDISNFSLNNIEQARGKYEESFN